MVEENLCNWPLPTVGGATRPVTGEEQISGCAEK